MDKKYRLLKDLPVCPAGTVGKLVEEWTWTRFYFENDNEFKNKYYVFPFSKEKLIGTWVEEVKPKRWSPKDGETYYYIGTDWVEPDRWLNHVYYSDRYINMNCFKTFEQATEAVRRCVAARKRYCEELMAKGELLMEEKHD